MMHGPLPPPLYVTMSGTMFTAESSVREPTSSRARAAGEPVAVTNRNAALVTRSILFGLISSERLWPPKEHPIPSFAWPAFICGWFVLSVIEELVDAPDRGDVSRPVENCVALLRAAPRWVKADPSRKE